MDPPVKLEDDERGGVCQGDVFSLSSRPRAKQKQ